MNSELTYKLLKYVAVGIIAYFALRSMYQHKIRTVDSLLISLIIVVGFIVIENLISMSNGQYTSVKCNATSDQQSTHMQGEEGFASVNTNGGAGATSGTEGFADSASFEEFTVPSTDAGKSIDILSDTASSSVSDSIATNDSATSSISTEVSADTINSASSVSNDIAVISASSDGNTKTITITGNNPSKIHVIEGTENDTSTIKLVYKTSDTAVVSNKTSNTSVVNNRTNPTATSSTVCSASTTNSNNAGSGSGSGSGNILDSNYTYNIKLPHNVKSPDMRNVKGLVNSEYQYSDYNTLPLSDKLGNMDHEYGYTFLPPANWYPVPPHPPVCVTEKKCPVCPVFTNGTNVELKHWDESRRITQPDNINVDVVTDKLNSGR